MADLDPAPLTITNSNCGAICKSCVWYDVTDDGPVLAAKHFADNPTHIVQAQVKSTTTHTWRPR